MLAPDDRAVLREQLRPDPGYELDMAVATTFTLDLTAALVAPLAFAAFDVASSSDPIAVLEAVRSATEKVTIFCQAGQRRVPITPSDLMAFLEPMVHDVRAPIPGYLFHPKVWVLRYRGADKSTTYRLLCGTRNLTDDVSWDAMVRLDGYPGTRRSKANGPLVEFVKALPAMVTNDLPSERSAAIGELAEDLRSVEWERPPGVKTLTFHALGLQRRRGTPPLVAAMRGRRHLIVSPFLDDAGISDPTAGSKERIVVSRSEALEGLDPATLEGLTCHILSPMAGLSEPDEEDDAPAPASTSLLGGLHAKAYVVEYDQQSRLFIGSANATSAGLGEHNVEFVVELQAGRKALGIDLFVGPDAPFASLLQSYTPTGGADPPPEDTLREQLDRELRRLADQTLVASVSADGDRWTEEVSGSKALDLPADMELRIGLLTRPGTAVIQEHPTISAPFSGLVTADVTPFIVLRLSAPLGAETIEQATVVSARLLGDPPGRLDEVLARQVDTPEKFMRFLALMLGLAGGPPLPSAETQGDGSGWGFSAFGTAGVFEMLVRAVGERPQAITDLERLVSRLEATEAGRAILPDGFSELWASVLAAHQQVGTIR